MALIPALIILLIGYFYFDPFKIFKQYNDYSYNPPCLALNRDYVSTTMFQRNREKYHYNSFIFGTSRTMGFKPSTRKKYLPESASPFSFDAGIESIFGIYTKIKYLDTTHAPIDNVLLLFDRDATFQVTDNYTKYLFIKHPDVTGESKIAYQWSFLKSYYSPIFLLNYYSYKLTGQYQDWMQEVILNYNMTYDTITNETNMVSAETLITKNEKEFYDLRKEGFFERKGETTDSVNHITETGIFFLNEIKRILEKHKTNYKIILTPIYDQIKFSGADQKIIAGLFGNHVYDFTGKNQFTDPITNFYEIKHFRPQVGDSILNIIYR